jgi:endonuclease/exonuclease/phosphatase family metal-dependent hydrolase
MRWLALMIALAGCGRQEVTIPDAARSDVPLADAGSGVPRTIVTLNLRCLIDDWDARLPIIVDGLIATDADVIGLQEVCAIAGGRDALEELVTALGDRGWTDVVAVRTTTHLAWDMYDEGLAVLSRHPIEATRVVVLPMGALPRKALITRIAAPGGRLVVATTHLDHQSATTRAAQASAAASAVSTFATAGEPAALVGDLNDQPGGGVATALSAAGWADAWTTVHSGDAGPTFPASGPTIRIDYVWVRDATPMTIERILQTPVSGVFASDHVGLRVQVR